MEATFVLDVQRNELRQGEVLVKLGHHRAGLFMGALVEAQQRGTQLTLGEYTVLWIRAGGTTPPDRTALRRVVAACRRALDALVPDGAARLRTGQRAETVGPWVLDPKPGDTWLLADARSCDASSFKPSYLPRLSNMPDPVASCAVARALLVADDLYRLGHYGDGALMLQEHLDTLPMSPEGRGLWQLRCIAALRHTGQHVRALAMVNELRQEAVRLEGRVGECVRGHVALLAARLSFNAAPHQASTQLDFMGLLAQVDAAPSARLYWEWSNLYGLALRRRIAAAMPSGSGIVDELVQHGHAAFEAAYYWAAMAQDAYHQQAIASNYAYFLYWLTTQGRSVSTQSAIAWFQLAHTLVERFELPQDSAWDFIMLGEMYFDNASARAEIDNNSLTWPEQSNPSSQRFYLRAIELAHSHGDTREQIMALDLYTRHLLQTGDRRNLRAALLQRDQCMAAHPDTVTELLKDGFRPSGQ